MTQHHWSRIVSWGELVDAVAQRSLTDKRLLQTLRHEEALGTVVAPLEVGIDAENWQATGWLTARYESGLSNFIERFGFDPTKKVFRNGRWERPVKNSVRGGSKNSQ